MKNMITRAFNKLFFLVSIVVVLSFSGSTMDASGQFANIVQEDGPSAMATTCSALLEGCGRNPSICESLLVPIYDEAAAEILALNLESAPDDIAIAKGIVKAAHITSVARNPSFGDALNEIESMCNEDLDAF